MRRLSIFRDLIPNQNLTIMHDVLHVICCFQQPLSKSQCIACKKPEKIHNILLFWLHC